MYYILLILGLTSLGNAKHSRIIGGVDGDIKDHPYLVSIEDRNVGPICGGALIARNLVLTAAHCLEKPPNFYSIRAGTSIRKYSGLIVDVLNYIYHDKYRFGESEDDYDICVVQTKTPFSLTSRIQVIQLINKNSVYPNNHVATFAGWGRQYEENEVPCVLKVANVESVPHKTCSNSYKGIGKTVTNRMMCFGSVEKDFCKGDDGGPLVESNKLIGIASWSVGCGRPRFPGVFIDVGNAYVYNFIKRCLTEFGVANH